MSYDLYFILVLQSTSRTTTIFTLNGPVLLCYSTNVFLKLILPSFAAMNRYSIAKRSTWSKCLWMCKNKLWFTFSLLSFFVK